MGAPGPLELSVVIPTLSRREKLRRALNHLSQQDAPPGSFEVLVVTDAAEPDLAATDALLRGRPFPARTLSGDRAGASAARNVGWRDARAPIVLFLDDDILAGPSLISQHLSSHHRHAADEVGVLGRVRWARELRVTPFMRWLERGIQFDYDRIEGHDAGWGRFYTANASVKRALIERVGGFDESRLPFGYEDLDLARRMSELGFRLLYNDAATAEHVHEMDIDFWQRRVRRIAVAERQFTAIHPDLPPYFHGLFLRAAQRPAARGRGARLARFIPRWTPVLGPRVWNAADLYFRQALAPHFLDAWEHAPEGAATAQPDLSERAGSSSGGSPPGGPK